jgi:hypothetical protein
MIYYMGVGCRGTSALGQQRAAVGWHWKMLLESLLLTAAAPAPSSTTVQQGPDACPHPLLLLLPVTRVLLSLPHMDSKNVCKPFLQRRVKNCSGWMKEKEKLLLIGDPRMNPGHKRDPFLSCFCILAKSPLAPHPWQKNNSDMSFRSRHLETKASSASTYFGLLLRVHRQTH